MGWCAVLGCKGSGSYKFPSNPALRRKWEKSLRRANFKATIHSRICIKHFKNTDFETISKETGFPLQRKFLKKSAIPTLFPWNSTSDQNSSSQAERLERRNANICLIPNTHASTVDPLAMTPIIIVHGGAGDIPDSRVEGKLIGTKAAVIAGHEVLINGGSALDAVEAAVVAMEKDENFNAGYGSVLNLDGKVEMEASIMSGTNLDVGAVTLIKDFLHPISIAHKVLTDSPHSLLGGEGAKRFALEKGFQTVPPETLISQNALSALQNFLKHGEFGRTEIGIKIEEGVGTVGAVAIDANGHIAVATSTGGMSGKAVGRIGDTPQIGSGTYADDNIGGVSTTGHGESILKYCLAHAIVKLMESGIDASTATESAVNGMTQRLQNTAGAITLSKNGDVGVYFSSRRMSWAYVKDQTIYYGIERNQVLNEPYPTTEKKLFKVEVSY